MKTPEGRETTRKECLELAARLIDMTTIYEKTGNLTDKYFGNDLSWLEYDLWYNWDFDLKVSCLNSIRDINYCLVSALYSEASIL